MGKYLYGAAVQGIQRFIFQTNELKEIIGASELVAQICDDLFSKILGKGSSWQLDNDPNCLVHAAGNVKYLFDSEETCKHVVRVFPMEVIKFAPGVTISQAVIPWSGNYHQDSKLLDDKLKIQRNKPVRSVQTGFIAVERDHRTGLPKLFPDGTDEGTIRKNEAFREVKGKSKLCIRAFGNRIPPEKYPFNISDITKDNDWIAVIHADGNSLGKVFQGIKNKDTLKSFSKELDYNTMQSAREAYEKIKEKYDLDEEEKNPIRPVVLSGDDFTVICRAGFALEYAGEFISSFEKKSFSSIPGKRLSACAGIAFVKSKFPFSFAYALAEELCSEAKKDARSFNPSAPASCIMFHKVQDSTVENYADIIQRELTPQTNISLSFGPYYISEAPAPDRWTLKELLEKSAGFNTPKGNGIKNAFRKWLSAIYIDPEMAKQLIRRAIYLDSLRKKDAPDKSDILIDLLNKLTDTIPDEGITYPIYDLLAINTIMSQKTR